MTKFMTGNKNKSFLRLCIIQAFLGLTFVISGCDTTPTPSDPRLIDRSFITRQPCAAPCWYGLEPDQSSETDVLAKLKELPFVDHTKIREDKNASIFDYTNASVISFGCAIPGGNTCGTVVSVKGIVKYFDLTIQYPLPLQSVIDQLGSPEYLFYTGYFPDGGGCRISLSWPQKRISVVSDDPNSTQLCTDLALGKAVNSGLQITEVHYESKEIALRDVCNQLKCIPWPGFSGK